MAREDVHARKQNPLFDLNKILRGSRYPRQNHLCKFWWRSVKGFRGGGGSKFALLHWLWSSPLQHCRTTVRVFEYVRNTISVMSLIVADLSHAPWKFCAVHDVKSRILLKIDEMTKSTVMSISRPMQVNACYPLLYTRPACKRQQVFISDSNMAVYSVMHSVKQRAAFCLKSARVCNVQA